MAMPAPVLSTRVFRPEPHLRVVKAMVQAQERATSSIPSKVLLAAAAVGVAVVLFLVLRTGAQETDPDQAWFWTPEWLAGELEADAEIAAGRGTFYASDEEFLASLDERPPSE
jgi:antitoxin PrlF